MTSESKGLPKTPEGVENRVPTGDLLSVAGKSKAEDLHPTLPSPVNHTLHVTTSQFICSHIAVQFAAFLVFTFSFQ